MNREHSILRIVVVPLLGLAAAAAAQAPPHVLCSTDAPLGLLRIVRGPCTWTSCPPAGLSPNAPVYAGGTAHDPRDRCTWVTDGTVLAKVDPRGGCAPQCTPGAIPGMPAGFLATGLALNSQTNQLFVSATDAVTNILLRLQVTGSCSLAWLNTCTLVVPGPNHFVSGLATDDVTGTIIYASTPWAGPNPWPMVAIYEAPQATPCLPSCGPNQVVDCAGLPVFTCTGLAFDPCVNELYVSDGRANLYTVPGASCTYFATACCQPIPPGMRVTGLCMLPSTEVAVGAPCTAGLVPPCTPTHTLIGDPAIANPAFALRLAPNAPAGSLYVAAFDIGACFQPTWLPLLCNVVPTNTLCSGITPGVCNGCTTAPVVCPLPLPNNPALCGVMVASLYFGLHFPCAAPNFADNWVSNCVEWVISGT